MSAVQWGEISLEPNEEAVWWFTWYQGSTNMFDHNHASLMTAAPTTTQPSTIQILARWTERDERAVTKHWVHFKNNGTSRVLFTPAGMSEGVSNPSAP